MSRALAAQSSFFIILEIYDLDRQRFFRNGLNTFTEITWRMKLGIDGTQFSFSWALSKKSYPKKSSSFLVFQFVEQFGLVRCDNYILRMQQEMLCVSKISSTIVKLGNILIKKWTILWPLY